jgi:hypothetical protein
MLILLTHILLAHLMPTCCLLARIGAGSVSFATQFLSWLVASPHWTQKLSDPRIF